MIRNKPQGRKPGNQMHEPLIARLRSIAGPHHVLTRRSASRTFLTGIRFGGGDALAVVRPRSLVQFWRILQACVEVDAAVIIQAANTGLTGGSTPYGNDYDRPIILIITMCMPGIHLINEGCQVICLPGATLHALEAKLRPLGREPHSVLGSTCIGASVVGGICNNSGGALVRRGPAYTNCHVCAGCRRR
jgi:D-lactate dehydrogenase